MVRLDAAGLCSHRGLVSGLADACRCCFVSSSARTIPRLWAARQGPAAILQSLADDGIGPAWNAGGAISRRVARFGQLLARGHLAVSGRGWTRRRRPMRPLTKVVLTAVGRARYRLLPRRSASSSQSDCISTAGSMYSRAQDVRWLRIRRCQLRATGDELKRRAFGGRTLQVRGTLRAAAARRA